MQNSFFPFLNTANMQEGKSRSTLYDYRLSSGSRRDFQPQNYICSPPGALVMFSNSSFFPLPIFKNFLLVMQCEDEECDSEGIPFAVRKLENLHNGCSGWWLSAKRSRVWLWGPHWSLIRHCQSQTAYVPAVFAPFLKKKKKKKADIKERNLK